MVIFYVTREKIYDKSGLTEDIQRSSEKIIIKRKFNRAKKNGSSS